MITDNLNPIKDGETYKEIESTHNTDDNNIDDEDDDE